MKHWRRLPREVMQYPSLKVFETQVHTALINLVWPQSRTCSEQEVGWETPAAPSSQNYPMTQYDFSLHWFWFGFFSRFIFNPSSKKIQIFFYMFLAHSSSSPFFGDLALANSQMPTQMFPLSPFSVGQRENKMRKLVGDCLPITILGKKPLIGGK